MHLAEIISNIKQKVKIYQKIFKVYTKSWSVWPGMTNL